MTMFLRCDQFCRSSLGVSKEELGYTTHFFMWFYCSWHLSCRARKCVFLYCVDWWWFVNLETVITCTVKDNYWLRGKIGTQFFKLPISQRLQHSFDHGSPRCTPCPINKLCIRNNPLILPTLSMMSLTAELTLVLTPMTYLFYQHFQKSALLSTHNSLV
jgi:hypothetical protein